MGLFCHFLPKFIECTVWLAGFNCRTRTILAELYEELQLGGGEVLVRNNTLTVWEELVSVVNLLVFQSKTAFS